MGNVWHKLGNCLIILTFWVMRHNMVQACTYNIHKLIILMCPPTKILMEFVLNNFARKSILNIAMPPVDSSENYNCSAIYVMYTAELPTFGSGNALPLLFSIVFMITADFELSARIINKGVKLTFTDKTVNNNYYLTILKRKKSYIFLSCWAIGQQ